jgi:hypothetical protein
VLSCPLVIAEIIKSAPLSQFFIQSFCSLAKVEKNISLS